ncbi:ATP-binding protein [Streptomyces sp. NPDC051940]|uniref:AAA family ATPase n=1 Tax=Streptomyces sp. NPDC051940 TaxID=3155675 RepID=UPI003412A955
MFDRDVEWSELTAFAENPEPGPSLGVVSGRRRQGKTFLLDSLAEATGGFYFQALEASRSESLAMLGRAVAEYTGSAVPHRPENWSEGIDLLFDLGREAPTTVVVDEFPYLVRTDPSLPSVIQAAIGARTGRHLKRSPRLLLCGSALSFMGGLLSGTSPLYGRASLNLVVHSLPYRQAAAFWGIDDPRLAVLTHAVVGGTPAYRRDFVAGDVPDGLADFDDWMCRTILNPVSAIYSEAPYLLAAESELRDRSLYHSTLAAVALGNETSGGIAGYLGRARTDVALPLTILRNCGLVTVEDDAFRRNRPRYRISEPLITFHHAVVRPEQAAFDRHRTEATWQRSQNTFLSKVVGPHFEYLCREWVLEHADPETFGGMPVRAAPGTVADPSARTSHEVDVVVHGAIGQDSGILLSVGEVKWNRVMDLHDLARLRNILGLLTARGIDTTHAVPACYSGAGFSPDLRAAEGRGEVVLVGLERLYRGE